MNAVDRQATFADTATASATSRPPLMDITAAVCGAACTPNSNNSASSGVSSASSSEDSGQLSGGASSGASSGTSSQPTSMSARQAYYGRDAICKQPTPNECATAGNDPTMCKDPRILVNMLATERATMPQFDYFRTVQRDIEPYMRKVVTTWMLEVCDEQHAEEQVYPLAINYLDRFLCLCPIVRNHFQLLGAVCLLLASKVRQCYAMTTDLLRAYTDYSVTGDELRNWEILMLGTLQWNINGTTAYDFISHILCRVPWGQENKNIHQHSNTLASICKTDMKFMFVTPSLLASACIIAAIRGVNAPSARQNALRDICLLTQLDPLEVEFTVTHVEQFIESHLSTVPDHPPAPTAVQPPQSEEPQLQTAADLQEQTQPQQNVVQPETPPPQIVYINASSAAVSNTISIDINGCQVNIGGGMPSSQPKMLDGEGVNLDDSGVMDPDTPSDLDGSLV